MERVNAVGFTDSMFGAWYGAIVSVMYSIMFQQSESIEKNLIAIAFIVAELEFIIFCALLTKTFGISKWLVLLLFIPTYVIVLIFSLYFFPSLFYPIVIVGFFSSFTAIYVVKLRHGL